MRFPKNNVQNKTVFCQVRTFSLICYLDTRIKQGDDSTPYHISVYDKRDDFDFRIVNFPHMDSNIPAQSCLRYLYISTGEICTDLHIQGRTSYTDSVKSRHVFIGKVSNLHFYSGRLQNSSTVMVRLLVSLIPHCESWEPPSTNKRHLRILFIYFFICNLFTFYTFIWLFNP